LPSPVAPQIDPPCRPDELRDDAEGRPSIDPLEYVGALRCIRAEAARVRGDAYPSKVEPVGVPVGLNSNVGLRSFVCE
jgi:hypothetical protein